MAEEAEHRLPPHMLDRPRENPRGPSMMDSHDMPQVLRNPPSFEDAANEIVRQPPVNRDAVLSGGMTEPLAPQAGTAPIPVSVDLSAVSLLDLRSVVEHRIARRPKDIRDAARALSQAFTEQVELIKNSKPNDPARLAEFEDLVAFFEKMAAGLANLVEALDRLIESAGTEREPIFLGKVGDIARQLNLGLMEWLQQNRMKVFDYPFKIAVFGAGILFLQHLGIAGDRVVDLIGGYILGRTTSPSKSNKD
jgi:hypothetical protein